MKSGVFWTCIGVIIALIIAICSALFPITKAKEINRKNQKKLVVFLIVLLAILLFFFGFYIYSEFREYHPNSSSTIPSEGINVDDSEDSNDEEPQLQPDNSSNEGDTTILRLQKIIIKNYYNSNGLLINGAMGHTEYYKHFFKFDVQRNEFEMFFKEQIDTDFNEVTLIFIDEESNILNRCAVFVDVPASEFSNNYNRVNLFNDNDFDNSYTIYFEDGLYRFKVIDDSNTYYSDFVVIDESKPYFINVTLSIE